MPVADLLRDRVDQLLLVGCSALGPAPGLDPRLGLVELVVEALLREQLVVRSLLDQLAVVQDEDQVGVADRGQPVGDHERGAALHQVLERVEDHGLGLGVDRGGRLVEDQDRRVLDEGARHADALALAARELCAPLAELGLVAVRQARDEVVGVGRLAPPRRSRPSSRRAARSGCCRRSMPENSSGSCSTRLSCSRRQSSVDVLDVVAVDRGSRPPRGRRSARGG